MLCNSLPQPRDLPLGLCCSQVLRLQLAIEALLLPLEVVDVEPLLRVRFGQLLQEVLLFGVLAPQCLVELPETGKLFSQVLPLPLAVLLGHLQL